MTTREEIKDEIYSLLKPYITDDPWKAEVIFVLTDKILKFLDSKGVRITKEIHGMVFHERLICADLHWMQKEEI